ncbi:MAG: hypothetical protein WKF37_08720 [Bryobacteraceae bacterium]
MHLTQSIDQSLNVPVRPDIALGAITAIIALLGSLVSLHPPVKRWHKFTLAAVFIGLAAGGMVLVVQQSNETAVANTKLSNAIQQLSASTIQTSKLQEKLLSQSDTISDLARQGITTATGGDSFCYMAIVNGNPIFLHSGKFPLYDVTARIVDLVSLRHLVLLHCAKP